LFLDFLCQLNALNRHGRRLEALEPEHRPDSLLYSAGDPSTPPSCLFHQRLSSKVGWI
jgi:hypothetical protein